MTRTSQHQVETKVLRKVIFAAALGNFVEWFDFAVYGFLATILAEQFFPSGDPTVSLLKTFAVFAVAFALRPLGGVFFGILGDHIGRRRTLALTILLMAGSTTTIGLLPTYQSVGVLAAVLLCVARSVQGFSAGGEYAGACAYVLEHCPPERKARYASFIPVSTFVSFAIAAVASFTMAASLSSGQMSAWGWRIPFLIAAPLGLFGFYIRWRLEETPIFHLMEAKQDVAGAPLRETIRAHYKTMLKLGGFISATALAFYTFTTYMSTYLQVVADVSRPTALLASVVSLAFAALLAPLFGRLSDRVGRKITMTTACTLLAVFVLPAFGLASEGSLWRIVGGQWLLALGTVMCNVVTAVLMSELFPTRVRYTASAVTYNLAYTIFGGTAPFVATYLIAKTDNHLAPAVYLLVVSLVAFLCALALPETSKTSLSDEPTERPPSASLPRTVVGTEA
jgi:MFS transporter, MHS family, proline/betaine transporter